MGGQIVVYDCWSGAAGALAEALGRATPAQRKLGEANGLSIPEQTPRIVAAALLKQRLSSLLDLPESPPMSEPQGKLLAALRRTSDPSISPQTREEASAWIECLLMQRRLEAIRELKLGRGDLVSEGNAVREVSSIGGEGRVHFKGGMGAGAWPDVLSVVARAGDSALSAEAARQQARNASARRQSVRAWSLAKRRDLEEFRTTQVPTNDDVDALELIIDSARDERPIQKHLQENPHVLAALLGGSERYCYPQKKLGAEYIPDFIIGDVDSTGIQWLLVELETPASGVYLKNDSQLENHARKGVQQVYDWRSWLADQVAYARAPRADSGLGLFDIREKTPGLVLVGRRALMPHDKHAARVDLTQNSDIDVHTYDWLLERLRGAVGYVGPSALNRYAVDLPE
jgi:Domain of unknown function (DUF4263)